MMSLFKYWSIMKKQQNIIAFFNEKDKKFNKMLVKESKKIYKMPETRSRHHGFSYDGKDKGYS